MPNAKLVSSDLAAAVLADDPALRNEVRELMYLIIRQMKHTMKYGLVTERNQLAKSITPQLLGALNSVDEGEAAAKKRAAYERMLAEVRGSVVVAKADK